MLRFFVANLTALVISSSLLVQAGHATSSFSGFSPQTPELSETDCPRLILSFHFSFGTDLAAADSYPFSSRCHLDMTLEGSPFGLGARPFRQVHVMKKLPILIGQTGPPVPGPPRVSRFDFSFT